MIDGGLHSKEDFDYNLLSCDTVQPCTWIPTLKSLLLLPILSQSVVIQLHYVTTQKTTI
jgi:hypothetical protein